MRVGACYHLSNRPRLCPGGTTHNPVPWEWLSIDHLCFSSGLLFLHFCDASVYWLHQLAYLLFHLFSFHFRITRLPVLEGEVSHVEIPRTSSALGMTIVGGADTPLVRESQPIFRASTKGRNLASVPVRRFLKGYISCSDRYDRTCLQFLGTF